MTKIHGYILKKEIYSDATISVYQAQKEGSEQTVIIKYLNNEYPALKDIEHLKNEFNITRHLNCTGIVKAIDLKSFQNSFAIIFEGFEGITLKAFLKKEPLNIKMFLKIAIEITEAIGAIHENHIIHKDVKPSNIIINPKTHKLKLTDFSISTHFDDSKPTLVINNQIEGTLPYMSPEQTGRINRTVDYRTDIYSLGVTFYEMITGQLPFLTEDPVELMHAHIAKIPTLPEKLREEIPTTISSIIMKCLKKLAEERYQSVYGLKADLLKCQEQLNQHQSIQEFSLGQQDVHSFFSISKKIYGRDQEFNQLQEHYYHVLNTKESELIMISGPTGIGKTAVLETLKKIIFENKSLYISCEFEELKTNDSFGALKEGFSSLIHQILKSDTVTLEHWKRRISYTLKSQARVLIDLIPDLKLLLGEQESPEKIGAIETQNRLIFLLQKFISVFAKKDHPFVIFLDNLQWVDEASISVLKRLLINNHIPSLLIITAFRNNDDLSKKPIQHLITEFKKSNVPLTEIKLNPLTLNCTNQLISDTFNRIPIQTIDLSAILFNKTQGTPLFLNQFLKNLYQEKIIYFDFLQGTWRWDLEKIKQIPASQNVLEHLSKKVKTFPKEIQQILRIASLIGDRVDLDILKTISNLSEEKLLEILWSAVYEELVFCIGNQYVFTHDKIRRAFSELMDIKKQKKLHLKIARYLVNQKNSNFSEILYHYNLAQDILTNSDEIEQVIQLNTQASQEMKQSASFQAAFQYSSMAHQLAIDHHLQSNEPLFFSLCVQKIECAYLSGQYREADLLMKKTLFKAKTEIDRLTLINTQIAIYLAQGKTQEGIQLGYRFLKELKIDPNQKITKWTIYKYQLTNKLKEILSLKKKKNKKTSLMLNLLENLSSSFYITNQQNLFNKTILKGLSLISLKNTNQSAASNEFIVSGYSLILLKIMEDIKSAKKWDQVALSLCKKHSNIASKAKTLYLSATKIHPWISPYRDIIPSLEKAFEENIHSGEMQYACLAIIELIWLKFYTSEPIENLLKDIEEKLIILSQLNQQEARNQLQIFKQYCLFLQSTISEEELFNNISFKQNKNQSESISMLIKHIQIQVYFLNKKYAQAFQIMQEIDACLEKIQDEIIMQHTCFYSGLIIAALLKSHLFPNFLRALALPIPKNRLLKQLKTKLNLIKQWSKNCPQNFEHKYLLLQAEWYHIHQKNKQAIQYYNLAIESAIQTGFTQVTALANECCALFYSSQNNRKLAIPYLLEAIYNYSKWGTFFKLNQIIEDYPDLTSYLIDRKILFSSSAYAKTHTASSTTSTVDQLLDRSTLIKFFQTISEEIQFDKLLSKVMTIILENTGAQKGFLILVNDKDGKFYIKAQKTISDESTNLDNHPIESSTQVCSNLIQYVIHTQKILALDDASLSTDFREDTYILKNQPKSLMCAPVIHQGKLIAVIYLENNITAGVFTKERQEVVQSLTSQTAVAIENAKLYQEILELNQTLENKVIIQTKELLNTNQKLSKTKEEAEKANHFKSYFLAQMTHDLRTPLHIIIGILDVMSKNEKIKKDEELEKQLSMALKSSEKQLSLVNDILDISKLESGKIDLHITPFEILDLFQGIEDIMDTLLCDKPIQFILENHLPKTLIISSDKKRVGQILINLLSNAAKFCETGEIKLKTYIPNAIKSENASDKSPPLPINRIYFEVSDTGIGLSSEQQVHIFEPYAMVDNQIQKQYQGTGLGLSICKGFVEALGGEIHMESELKKGTTFIFWIPLILAKKSIPIKKEPENIPLEEISKTIHSKSILLCDDDEFNRMFAQMIFSKKINFQLADSGPKAIELVKNNHFDLIFMDLQMPNMDGKTTLQEIQKINKTIPIIALTAQATKGVKEELINFGFSGYLSKPFKEEEILTFLYHFFIKQTTSIAIPPQI